MKTKMEDIDDFIEFVCEDTDFWWMDEWLDIKRDEYMEKHTVGLKATWNVKTDELQIANIDKVSQKDG